MRRLCICFVLLASLSAPAWAEDTLWSPRNYRPTGDALFDRYAAHVLQQDGDALALGNGERHPLTLPDEVLAGWEADFDEDPRYWQLRYFCEQYRYAHPYSWLSPQIDRMEGFELAPRDDPDGPARFLLQARRRGVADWETLMLLHGRASAHAYGGVAALPEHEVDETYGEETARERERRLRNLGLHMQALESAELALLDQAIAADPSEASPWYARAEYWLSFGEPERALADIMAGNQASYGTTPAPFPLNFALDQLVPEWHYVLVNGKLPSDAPLNYTLYGGLLEVWLLNDASQMLRRNLKSKERCKEAEIMLSLSGDRRIHQAMLEMFARQAVNSREGRANVLLAAVKIRMLDEAMLHYVESEPTALVEHEKLAARVLELEQQRVEYWATAKPGLLRLSIDMQLEMAPLNSIEPLIYLLPLQLPVVPVDTPEILAQAEALREPTRRWALLTEIRIQDAIYAEETYLPIFRELGELDYDELLAQP